MILLAIVALAWLGIGVCVALVIAASIRLADRRQNRLTVAGR